MYIKMLMLFVIAAGVSSGQWNKAENFPEGEVGSVFVDGDTIYAARFNKLYYNANGGITWNESVPFNDDEASFTSSIVKYKNRIFLGTYNGIYETADNGNNWITRNNGLNETGAKMINDLEIRGDSIYAATEGAAIFVMNLQNGDVWIPYRNGLDFGIAWNASTIYNMNGTLLAGAGGSAYVYKNSPGSDLWIYHAYDSVSAVQNYMLDFIHKDSVLLGASTLAEYRSTDGGTTWQRSYLGTGYIAIARFVEYGSKIYLFLPKLNGAYYFSTLDLGVTWDLIETDRNFYVPYDFAIYNNKFFTGTYDGLFYRDMNPTSVDDDINPVTFTLSQNYPNPFNPTTNIEFRISEPGFVKLTIYDLLGKEVATLVNEERPAGTYMVSFDVSNLPEGRQGLSSGVYYYKLTAGSFFETKKMVMLK